MLAQKLEKAAGADAGAKGDQEDRDQGYGQDMEGEAGQIGDRELGDDAEPRIEGQGEGQRQQDQLDKDVGGDMGLEGEPLGEVGEVAVGQGETGDHLEDKRRDADALES